MRNDSNADIQLLSDATIQNDEYISCFKKIDDNLDDLHKVIPHEYREALYTLEAHIGKIVNITNSIAYGAGLKGGVKFILDTIGRKVIEQ